VVCGLAEKAEQDLAKLRAEYDKMVKDKDMTIETLTLKVNTMCVQFETLFHVSIYPTACRFIF